MNEAVAEDTLLGYTEDAHGRRIEVWADRSGAVRLGLGLTDLMLPAAAWRELAALGDHALAIGEGRDAG